MIDETSYVVGVDIGTTSTKAVVFNREGKVEGHATVGYPLHTPAPGVAEQDPDENLCGRALLDKERDPRVGCRSRTHQGSGLQRRHAQRDRRGQGGKAADAEHHLGGHS
jgi:molecular chaperone DnaK (HSP70)